MKDGSYFRKDDSRLISRFRCRSCGKRFSSSTYSLEFRQKKRRVNCLLWKLLSSNVSLRRSAYICNVHPITVARKLIYIAKKSRIEHVQFDDLIISEHTKLKPLSVSIAVAKNRTILGIRVSIIPAFGPNAKI